MFQIYDYKEIVTPLFEDKDLFVRSIGQTSDIVEKQMLALAGQRQEEQEGKTSNLVLRPEGTAPIVRSYIQNHLDKKENLSKFFYIGPMFRGERPQKGRLRQFHQIGAEAIGPGSASPYLDAEMVILCTDLLKTLGLNGFEVTINTLGTGDDKKNFSSILRGKLEPRVKDLCPDCRQRIERNVFRVLDCKNNDCQDVVRQISVGYDHLAPESRDYYEQFKSILSDSGIAFVESPRLVRGLDYYTHTVFEISSPSLGSQDALGAGGRYNNLVSQLGGTPADAVGFALGMERLLLARPGIKIPAVSLAVFFIALDKLSFQYAFNLLNQLRARSIKADICYEMGSLKSQMRIANKKQAEYVIILGENELKNKTATVKNMASSQQITLPLDAPALEQFISRQGKREP